LLKTLFCSTVCNPPCLAVVGNDRSTLILQALLTTACTFSAAKRAVEF
jgi:hypothetical protein